MRMRESEPLCMTRNATWHSHCEEQFGLLSKVKVIICLSNSTSRPTCEETESRLSQRYAYVSVWRSNFTTHNLWKLFKCLERSDKISVLKKEGNSSTCFNMNELQGHYTKLNMPFVRDSLLLLPRDISAAVKSQIIKGTAISRVWKEEITCYYLKNL